ncbi:hypothetical protein BASA81_002729 [Batrachochytrium salamandrivorans]|nr:hypothetical protein BASA81_002729 [Batrachochytrium salamandrivorans]
MLVLEKLEVQYPNRVLIRDSRLALMPGHRYCLIGPSGVGKSSLLLEIQRQYKSNSLTVALVKQSVMFDNPLSTVLQCALASTVAEDPECPERDEQKRTDWAIECLREIGFSKSRIFTETCGRLSQGWKQRLALICAVLSEPDLLLVDEVSEGVDLLGTMKIERFLVDSMGDGILLAISHDTEFLSAMGTDVIYIDEDSQTLKQFAGGYLSYIKREEERLLAMESRVDSAQRKKAHAQRFIAKHGTDPSKQKQVKEKKDKLDRQGFFREDGRRYKTHSLQKLDEKYVRLPEQTPDELKLAKPLHFKQLSLDDGGSSSTMKMGDTMLVSLENANVGYATRPTLLCNVSVYVTASSRIAVVGENSSGKSTLMHCLLQDDPSIQTSMPVQVGTGRIRMAFVPQCEGARLAEKYPNFSPAQLLISEIKSFANERDARQYLGGFGLSGPVAVTPIAHLSCGQQTRLAIAVGCVASPQLLVLDEPTHALDVPARLALAQWITAFPGALVVSSHDRNFLRDEQVGFNELWAVGRKGCVTCTKAPEEDEDGGFQQVFDDYLASIT